MSRRKPNLKAELSRALDDLKVLGGSLEATAAAHARVASQLEHRTSELHAAHGELEAIKKRAASQDWVKAPVPLILHCPECSDRHVCEGGTCAFDGAGLIHACDRCGFLWVPSLVQTVGVSFLPGCKSPTP